MNNILIHSVRISDIVSVYTNGENNESIFLQLWNELSNSHPKLKFQKVYFQLQYNIDIIRNGIEWQLKKNLVKNDESNVSMPLSGLKLKEIKSKITDFFKGETGLEIEIFGPDQPELDDLKQFLLFRVNKKGNVRDEPRKFIFNEQSSKVGKVRIKNLGFIKGKTFQLEYLGAKWKFAFVIYDEAARNQESLFHYPENDDFFFSKPELGILSYLKRSKKTIPDYSKKLLTIPSTFESIATVNTDFKKTIIRAKYFAERDSNILILGDTGTGKELFAQAIWKSSKRKDKPFKAVNCANFSKEMIESQLFGHIKGAFTGAIEDRTGVLEEVNEGTLFLDEIGELDVIVQAKLLRVLETGKFEPLGSNKTVESDFRLLSATNKDIEKESLFRADLYHRINHCKINLPPLSIRGIEDIKHLTEFFRQEIQKGDVDDILVGAYFSSEALDLIGEFDWPGNVRQLMHFVTKVFDEVLFKVHFEDKLPDSNGKLRIEYSDIAQLLANEVTGKKSKDSWNTPNSKQDSGRAISDDFDRYKVQNLKELLSKVERDYIKSAVIQSKGQNEAAVLLGLSQPELSRKIKEFGWDYKEMKKQKKFTS